MRVHDLVPRLARELLDRAAPSDAGVVDKNVERAEAIDDLPYDARYPFLVADVELEDGFCFELVRRRLVLCGITAGDGNGRARRSQAARDRQPEPAVAAGDQRNATVEREQPVAGSSCALTLSPFQRPPPLNARTRRLTAFSRKPAAGVTASLTPGSVALGSAAGYDTLNGCTGTS